MEGAVCLVVGACFFQFDIVSHHIDDIDTALERLYGCIIYHREHYSKIKERISISGFGFDEV
jgi:hypothetical protein